MTEYKRNHTIPVSILEYWIDENTPHKSVHVYDIKSQHSHISTSLGKKPFSFAFVHDLYVHDTHSKRAVGLEKWFSKQEGSLSILTRQANNRQPIEFKKSDEMTKIMMALTSFEYRSNYAIKKIYDFIKDSEGLRKKISANPERPLKQLVLENIIHVVTDQHIDYMPAEMIFFFSPENCHWVISDRPFLYHDSFEYRFVVLTNKVVVGYRHSPKFVYNYVDINNENFEEINKMFAMNAREWLVAKNEKELNKYSALFLTKEWKDSLKEDDPFYKPIKNLISGSTIDR